MSVEFRDQHSEVRKNTRGLSTVGSVFLVSAMIIAIIGASWVGFYFGAFGASSSSQTNNSLQDQINSLQNQVNSVQSNLWKLPIGNQTPTTRNIMIEWTLATAGQDRFFPSQIIVNQGDNVSITFESNDTDAHTLTIGSPYNFQINDTEPNTQNYLENEKNFTTPSTDNSAGVKVYGAVGNITGTGSFIAKYAGIYEYYCVYHLALGMFGYLIVLPNAAYGNHTGPYSGGTSSGSTGAKVNIVNGAYNQNQAQNFVPDTIVVVIGINNTVTWVNNDLATHTVTSDTGAFDSGNLNPGQSWSYTFTTPGTYSYHCSIHPWMTGTVIVESQSAG